MSRLYIYNNIITSTVEVLAVCFLSLYYTNRYIMLLGEFISLLYSLVTCRLTSMYITKYLLTYYVLNLAFVIR